MARNRRLSLICHDSSSVCLRKSDFWPLRAVEMAVVSSHIATGEGACVHQAEEFPRLRCPGSCHGTRNAAVTGRSKALTGNSGQSAGTGPGPCLSQARGPGCRAGPRRPAENESACRLTKSNGTTFRGSGGLFSGQGFLARPRLNPSVCKDLRLRFQGVEIPAPGGSRLARQPGYLCTAHPR